MFPELEVGQSFSITVCIFRTKYESMYISQHLNSQLHLFYSAINEWVLLSMSNKTHVKVYF